MLGMWALILVTGLVLGEEQLVPGLHFWAPRWVPSTEWVVIWLGRSLGAGDLGPGTWWGLVGHWSQAL